MTIAQIVVEAVIGYLLYGQFRLHKPTTWEDCIQQAAFSRKLNGNSGDHSLSLVSVSFRVQKYALILVVHSLT